MKTGAFTGVLGHGWWGGYAHVYIEGPNAQLDFCDTPYEKA
jgi:hypothetical protein